MLYFILFLTFTFYAENNNPETNKIWKWTFQSLESSDFKIRKTEMKTIQRNNL